jgi:hypothetical protein
MGRGAGEAARIARSSDVTHRPFGAARQIPRGGNGTAATPAMTICSGRRGSLRVGRYDCRRAHLAQTLICRRLPGLAEDACNSVSCHLMRVAINAHRGQLFLAPWKIQLQISWRRQLGNGLWPCGIPSAGAARPSISTIRLLISGLPGTTIGPYLVPFISP